MFTRSTFAAIWSDLKSGQNVDTYGLVALAVLALVLSGLGIIGSEVVGTVILTGFAVVGISLLLLRRTAEAIREEILQSRIGGMLSWERPYSLADLLSGHDSVWLGGIDLSRTVSSNQSAIEAFLRRGGRLRVLLYDPDGVALDHALQRSLRPFDRGRQQELIRGAISDCAHLAAGTSGSLEVRVSPFPFYFGFVATGEEVDLTPLCVKHFAYRASSYDGPWISILPSEVRFRRQSAEEILALWSDGKPAVSPP